MWEYLYQVVDDGGGARLAKNLPLLPDLDHAHNFRVDIFILLAEDAFEGFWEDLYVFLDELRTLVSALLEWEGWKTERVKRGREERRCRSNQGDCFLTCSVQYHLRGTRAPTAYLHLI